MLYSIVKSIVMTCTVSARSELTQTTVAPLVAAVEELSTGSASNVILDLRSLLFAHPFPLVVLAAVVEARGEDGDAVTIRCPSSPDACQYLAACGFLQEMDGQATLEGDKGLSARPKSWGAGTVLPVTRLDHDGDVAAVLDRIDRRLGRLLEQPKWEADRIISAVRSSVQEICANIFQHAAYDIGWIAAQQYRNQYTGIPYVEIGIADAGRGIKASLSTAYAALRDAPDSTAIREALNGRSRRHGRHGGTGFRVLQRAAKELDGQFYLRSGRGGAMRPRRGGLRHSTAEESWPGTHLKLVVSCG